MLDVVIPIHGQLESLKKTIDSLIENTYINFRVIIINDNCNDKELIKYLDFLESFRTYIDVINSGYRRYWAGCCNIGAANCSGEHICFLHSDVYVRSHWASYLINMFKTTFGCSAIGPRTSWSNTKQTVGEYEKDRENLTNEEIEKLPVRGKPISANIDSFCFLTSRENWNRVGPFNEEIWKGLYSELDWQLRATEYDLYPYIARNVYVHHHGKKSYNQELSEYDKNMKSSFLAVVSKYNKELVQKIIK